VSIGSSLLRDGETLSTRPTPSTENSIGVECALSAENVDLPELDEVLCPERAIRAEADLRMGSAMTSAKSSQAGESALRPEITLFLGILLVVNATIGTGIFKTPAKVARLSGSMTAAMGVWVLGGVIALCGALSLAELSAAIPRAGGIYEVLRRTWGERVAFVYGWAKLTLLIPAAVGSFAKLTAESLTSFFGWGADTRRDGAIAVGLIALCAAANVTGVKTSAIQQAIVTLAKYLGVALLGIIGIGLTVHGPVPGVDPSVPYELTPTVTGCFTALVSVMWAYDGWADLSSLAAEVRNPGRTMPRALIAGTAAIIAVYLTANWGYAHALGIDGLRGATTGTNMAAARLAAVTLGGPGRQLLALLIIISCVGGCMSSLLTGPRIFIPLATDGLFIGWLGGVNPKTAVPARAVVVCAVLGCAYVLLRSFEQLTDAFVVGYFPFYMLAVAAVYRLRQTEPALERPFRVPLYPAVPAVFLLGAAALMYGALADVDKNAAVAAGVLLCGLPVSWLFSRTRST
jgi:APA family basic amino acid/polyamine antiporter